LALGVFFLGTLALIGITDEPTRVNVSIPLYLVAMFVYLFAARCQFASDIERLAKAIDCHVGALIDSEYMKAQSYVHQVLVNYAALFLYAEKVLGLQDPRLEKVFKKEFRERHEIFLKFKLCNKKWDEYFNDAKSSSPPNHLKSIVDKMKE
jgi:hypothetical protein